MSETSWLAYTGAVAGIIGAITGIAGAVTGYYALRRTSELKALDLRVDLRRTESTLRVDIQDLVPLLERAKRSRTRLAAAQGRYRSGAISQWLVEWDADLAEANSLVSGSSVLDVDCTDFAEANLELRLLAVHRLRDQVTRLSKKYIDAIAEDDRGRDHLREDQRAFTQARLEGKK